MGQQRYSPEFKDEAVRQVTERGALRRISPTFAASLTRVGRREVPVLSGVLRGCGLLTVRLHT